MSGTVRTRNNTARAALSEAITPTPIGEKVVVKLPSTAAAEHRKLQTRSLLEWEKSTLLDSSPSWTRPVACWDYVDVYTGSEWPPPTLGCCNSSSTITSTERLQWERHYNQGPPRIPARRPRHKRRRCKELAASNHEPAVISSSVEYEPSAWHACNGTTMYPRKRPRTAKIATTTRAWLASFCAVNASTAPDEDDYSGKLGDQVWDPIVAIRAEGGGENIATFLARATEFNVHMIAMEVLHRCDYNVARAEKKLMEVLPNAVVNGLVLLSPSAQRDRVLKALQYVINGRAKHISMTKEFDKLSKRLGCRKEMLLVHYYIWKSTTCVICSEVGGSITGCPSCQSNYHVSCVDSILTKRKAFNAAEQPVKNGLGLPCHGHRGRGYQHTPSVRCSTCRIAKCPCQQLTMTHPPTDFSKPSLVQDISVPSHSIVETSKRSNGATVPYKPMTQGRLGPVAAALQGVSLQPSCHLVASSVCNSREEIEGLFSTAAIQAGTLRPCNQRHYYNMMVPMTQQLESSPTLASRSR